MKAVLKRFRKMDTVLLSPILPRSRAARRRGSNEDGTDIAGALKTHCPLLLQDDETGSFLLWEFPRVDVMH